MRVLKKTLLIKCRTCGEDKHPDEFRTYTGTNQKTYVRRHCKACLDWKTQCRRKN